MARVSVAVLALVTVGAIGCGGVEGSDPEELGTDASDLTCPYWFCRYRTVTPDAGTPAPTPVDAGTPTTPGTTTPVDAGTTAPAPTPIDTGTGPAPAAQFLPAPTGACPTLANGDITFAPAGIAPRKVRIWMSSAAATLDGPLVFYWHGTGSSPSEATYGLSQPIIDEIVAKGGIVAAPYHDSAAGTFPWFLTTAYGSSGRLDDLLVADEVLACAMKQVGIDRRHIHSMGMSAGGLQTTQMSYRRSGYIASVVTYSGGLNSMLGAPTRQDATNPFTALIFHGGTSDVIGMSFQQASENYWKDLNGRGQFAAICNHGGGHSIPTDARTSVWEFFKSHPFGVRPDPYAAGLPAGFPTYCKLQP